MNCERFITWFFFCEDLSAPRLNPKLKEHPLSVVRDCLLNIFAATFHTEGRSSNRNLRKRYALVAGTHLSRNREPKFPLHNPRRKESPKFKTANVRNVPAIAVMPALNNSSGQHLNFPRKAQTACTRLITTRKLFVTHHHYLIARWVARLCLFCFLQRISPSKANVTGQTWKQERPTLERSQQTCCVLSVTLLIHSVLSS